VAMHMGPAVTIRICREAARICLHTPDRFDGSDVELLSVFVQSLDSENATQAARVITSLMVSDPERFLDREQQTTISGQTSYGAFNTDILKRFLTKGEHSHIQRRTVASATAVGMSASSPLASLVLLPSAGEPLPCRLTTQDLVELLKLPTCVSEVRRVILDQLGNRYGRRFDTHWDFVRYAQEHQLNLDFTTPPKRPEPKLPPLFEE
jgi:hypothetical protein